MRNKHRRECSQATTSGKADYMRACVGVVRRRSRKRSICFTFYFYDQNQLKKLSRSVSTSDSLPTAIVVSFFSLYSILPKTKGTTHKEQRRKNAHLLLCRLHRLVIFFVFFNHRHHLVENRNRSYTNTIMT